MENVLNQAEQLAEAILDSEEFIKMRLAEQAALKDVEANRLMDEYTQKRHTVESLLASSALDHGALEEAGTALETAQKAMEENGKIKAMRETNAAFTDMMKQVNKIIKFVVTGESEEEEACSCGSCAGGCDSCGGCEGC